MDNTNNEESQTRLDKLVRDIYQSGNTTGFDAATNGPLSILQGAPVKAAGYLSNYRRALAVGVTQPGEADIPADYITSANVANISLFGKPGDSEVPKARLNLDKLLADVDEAEARLLGIIQQARQALDLGDRQLGRDELEAYMTGPLVTRLDGIEQALRSGMPRVRTALAVARDGMQSPQGGTATSLIGWGDEVIGIPDAPYSPPQEVPWYEGMGGRIGDYLDARGQS